MNKQTETLEQRIFVALQPDNSIRSTDVAALIAETEAVIADAEKEHAVDPRSADPRAARQAIIDAMCTANRLGPLLPKLQARYRDALEQEHIVTWLAEREATWLAKQDAWIVERDALVEELRDVYPEPTRRMADLFVRIAANNKTLDELNRTRPQGVHRHLHSVELAARGLDGFSNNKPSLLTSVCLFDWDTGQIDLSTAAAVIGRGVCCNDDARFRPTFLGRLVEGKGGRCRETAGGATAYRGQLRAHDQGTRGSRECGSAGTFHCAPAQEQRLSPSGMVQSALTP